MSEHLSPAWIDDLDRALGASDLRSDLPLILAYEVTETATYHIAVGPNGASAALGFPSTVTAAFTQDAGTAKAIHRGELTAEEAFITGQLIMNGDALALLGSRELLADLATVTASVRADA